MTLTPEELASRLHAELDNLDVAGQPWPAVRGQLNLRRRRRRTHAAAALSASLAVVAISAGLSIALPGQHSGNVAGSASSPPASAPARHHASPGPGIRGIAPGTAAQHGFLVYVAGRNLSGPVLSSTSIAGGNSAWLPSRNNLTLAASSPGRAYWSPSISPGRAMVVFVEGSAGHVGAFAGEGDLVIARTDGSSSYVVTTANTDANPVWSPDGHQIAFIRNGRIWLMSSDGSHQHALGFGPPAHTVSWSPDSQELAVGSGNSPERIAIINIPHRSFRWFTPAGHIEQYQPSWSPDGKQLVYGQTGPNALFVSNLDGTGTRRLTTCTSPRCTQDVEPAWSPDGSQIAFVRSKYGVQQVAVVAASGGKVRLITAGPDQHNQPSW
jgi:Tol biopolymer transport system component